MADREQRFLTSRPLQVFHSGQRRTVQVSNFSSTGACLNGLRPLPVGTPLTIHHNSLRIEAAVAWCRNGSTGVRFLKPLEFDDLLEFQIG